MSKLDQQLSEFREDIQEKITDIILRVIEDYDTLPGAPVASPHIMAKEITKYIFDELL